MRDTLETHYSTSWQSVSLSKPSEDCEFFLVFVLTDKHSSDHTDTTDTTMNVLLRATQPYCGGGLSGFVDDRKLYALSSSPSLKPRLQRIRAA